MEEKYIHLKGDYYLSADKYQFILNKKVKNKDTFIYRPESYYGSLDQLYKALCEKNIRDNIDILENASACEKLINHNAEIIKSLVKEIEKK